METSQGYMIFDRLLLRQRLARAAKGFAAHDFLYREAAMRLAERRADIKRDLPRVLELGCREESLMAALAGNGVRAITALTAAAFPPHVQAMRIVADEEYLPFAPASFGVIFGNLNFQTVNDLPGALLQCRHILAPGGVFLAAMLGGGTLRELRECLYAAEQEETGGVSPRVAPFADAAAMAGLLQRAGFALPVADQETVTAHYPDMFALMRELRGMGMSNMLCERLRRPSRRAVFARAAALYESRYPVPGGGIMAGFDVIYLHGWAPE